MEISLNDIQLEVSNSTNLSSAIAAFKKADKEFQLAGGDLDFNTRVTTRTGTVGYKAVFQNQRV
ncbi:MAG: hypothetical protein KDK41_15630 [Leptospiraceae bacterium]|nr:hypothetical protein [Leptospiraceae bacterium]